MPSREQVTYRYIIVSLKGDMDDVQDAIDAIDACGREALANVEATYWGCEGCGCPTKSYSPMETQPCEELLCGHDCEDCGCYAEDYEDV